MTKDYGDRFIEAIDDWLESHQEKEPRGHLGASLIGRECGREIWYGWRWAKFPFHGGRMLRLFDRGHKEEFRFVEWIKPHCDEIHEIDPRTGEQFRITDFNGYFGGSLDGMVKNPIGLKGWFLLEFKTHSLKSYEKLKMKGVKEAKPEHYVQMQLYLSYFPKLKGAFYFAICKNDDALYVEFVERDDTCASENRQKAADLVMATEPPPRPNWGAPFNFYCKNFCDFSDICHNNATPRITCRSCGHIELREEGWTCGKTENLLDTKAQLAACDSYQRGW